MAGKSYLDAAVVVLRDVGWPLTDHEITNEALQRGLINPRGKTPRATMSARLYIEARDNPDGPLVRVSEPGPTRARRGSVRWALREGA